ncbi:hypothetical protein ACH5RR_033972 [Cinchona calisaya]|uniref:Uncharacterized protein n=1 Tax=Cinchona calisaya TaxID=153742 RepID=A0ABD2YBQ9_9GENT
MSKLESQNIGEASQANNNKSDQNPQMDKSARVYFGSFSKWPVDDSMNLLATVFDSLPLTNCQVKSYKTIQFGTVKPSRVYVLRTKSPNASSNKDNERWKLVTRRKKVMRKSSWRAHERATKALDGKQGAMKKVKKPSEEDVGHGHHQPSLASLYKFFPNVYFGQNTKEWSPKSRALLCLWSSKFTKTTRWSFDLGLHPSIFRQLGTSKDCKNKSEWSPQKSMFKRIGARDIKAHGKGLKRLRQEADDSNEIHSTVPSRMMRRTR